MLFVAHLTYKINLEWSLIAPWITKPHLIMLWWPSIYHKLFGLGTLYFLSWKRQAYLSLEFTGSILSKAFQTVRCCTRLPVGERCPRIMDLSQKFPWFLKSLKILSESPPVIIQKPVSFSMQHSVSLPMTIYNDTNRGSAISFHEYPKFRKWNNSEFLSWLFGHD